MMGEHVDSIQREPDTKNSLGEIGNDKRIPEVSACFDHSYSLPEEDDLESLSQQIPHLIVGDDESKEFCEHPLHPLIEDYHERMLMKRKLEELFRFDEGDRNRSIERFYRLALNKLTSFAFAVMTLNTGMVLRAPTWKDQLGESLLSFIDSASQTVGEVGSFAMGAGAVVHAAILPLLSGTGTAWRCYRDHVKQMEYRRAAQHYDDGIDGIERKNRHIAYQLASLLKMQLRYCTARGAETIVDDWLYRLFYQLMKDQSGGQFDEERARHLAPLLSFIDQGREKKSAIETHAEERNWNTLGLFLRSGIAYYDQGELHYDSCFALDEAGKNTIPLSRAEKYGYLFFSTSEEADHYKAARTEDYAHGHHPLKLLEGSGSLIWRRDKMPKGPKIYLKDTSHISAPTLLLSYKAQEKKESEENEGPHVIHAKSLPVISTLFHRMDHLNTENKMLAQQLSEQALRLKMIEERMAQMGDKGSEG